MSDPSEKTVEETETEKVRYVIRTLNEELLPALDAGDQVRAAYWSAQCGKILAEVILEISKAVGYAVWALEDANSSD